MIRNDEATPDPHTLNDTPTTRTPTPTAYSNTTPSSDSPSTLNRNSATSSSVYSSNNHCVLIHLLRVRRAWAFRMVVELMIGFTPRRSEVRRKGQDTTSAVSEVGE
ncbi:unnamed protein product [Gadus morhua 'NCC']